MPIPASSPNSWTSTGAPRRTCWLWSSLRSLLRGARNAFQDDVIACWRNGVAGRAREGTLDTSLEDHFNLVANYVALAIECGAVFVVAFGALQAISSLFRAIATGQATGAVGREIWLRFATWILLALEFALAADILRTAVAPTWDDISKLAVIATIRTMLNYFLAKDIMAFDRSQGSGRNAGTDEA